MLYLEISKRFGTIKRSRSCFLYTEKGIRLTDLYQEAGRAILGWGEGSAFTMMKNVLSRGVTGSFNTDFFPRLEKAVSELLASNRKIFIFSEKNIALAECEKSFGKKAVLWKPWNPSKTDWQTEDFILLAPPLPWTQTIWILAVNAECIKDVAVLNTSPLAPPLTVGVTRAIYDMIQALQERAEKDWFLYDTVLTKYWTRKGPYLYPKMAREEYDAFVLHCLDCNLVISPDYDNPSIVPYGADKGVFTLLKRNEYGAK